MPYTEVMVPYIEIVVPYTEVILPYIEIVVHYGVQEPCNVTDEPCDVGGVVDKPRSMVGEDNEGAQERSNISVYTLIPFPPRPNFSSALQ